MIVKNESKVIHRCLSSVQKFIDYWMIVDTGSTDGTQQAIQKFMKNIPGELHERSWVNFEHNRNEALALARDKSDYTLFIDADERLFFSQPFERPSLDRDCYRAVVHAGVHAGLRILMVRNALDWKWHGILHEEITAPSITNYEDLKNVIVLADTQDGYRSQDPSKYLKDAKILEEALKEDPSNARYVFYLAQSYGNAKEYHLALNSYENRVAMGGNVNEVFWSLYMIGILQKALDFPSDSALSSLWKAHHYQPRRAEPLYAIAYHYFSIGDFTSAYLFSKFALPFRCPQETGYILYNVYDYELLLLFADAAYELKKREEAKAAYLELLQKKYVPQKIKERIKRLA